MSQEILDKRIEETHGGEWIKFSGVSSILSFLLPVLSELEGVGEEVFMVVGGAGAASVFSVLMKVARVGSAVQDIHEEQDELRIKDTEEECKKIKKERIRRKQSQYLNDPIGWDDSELNDV
jgi:hypothetical protein